MDMSFFKTIIPEIPENTYFLLWHKQDKRSYWIDKDLKQDLGKIVHGQDDFYFMIGLAPKNFGTRKRCPQDKICGLVGFGVDIDCSSNLDKKARFKDKDVALNFIYDTLPEHLTPTLINDTGNGLQPLWIFKEPWLFDTDLEHKEAIKLSHGLNMKFRYNASILGVEIDSVYNLDRLFRVPDTFNAKEAKNKKPVKIIKRSNRYYNPDDFEDYLEFVPKEVQDVNDVTQTTNYNTENKHKIDLSPDRPCPTQMISIFCDNYDSFQATWDMQRSDFKEQSLSNYDMSIACHVAANNQGTPQMIADFILWFRKKHGTDKDIKKALRLDYLNRTIDAAQNRYGSTVIPDEVDRINEDHKKKIEKSRKKGQKYEVTQEDRDKAMVALSEFFGFQVYRIKKYTGDTPIYYFDMDVKGVRQEVRIGDIKDLRGQNRLKDRLAATCDITLKFIKPKFWSNKIEPLLISYVSVVETGPDSYQSSTILSILKRYIESGRLIDNKNHAYHDSAPFTELNKTYMFFMNFMQFIRLEYGLAYSHQQVAQELSRHGALHTKKQFQIHDEESTDLKKVRSYVYDVTKPLENIKNDIQEKGPETVREPDKIYIDGAKLTENV